MTTGGFVERVRTGRSPTAAASAPSDGTAPDAFKGFIGREFGDDDGVAIADGVAHPIWTDSRRLSASAEEIYTTTLTAPLKDGSTAVRLARAHDAPAFGRLLHAFNTEFGEPTPDAELIAERAAPLIESGEVTVLFAGEGPDGFAELRFRPSVYTGALDAYLEELYVVPERRGRGLGRALLEAAMDHARECGAAHIDLGTSENDVAARGLYESAGFTNREGGPDGPRMLYYERDL
jgi:GNAT superfamily N-acetyltransferase